MTLESYWARINYKGFVKRDEGTAILNGFIYVIPNHWALGSNCAFTKFYRYEGQGPVLYYSFEYGIAQ